MKEVLKASSEDLVFDVNRIQRRASDPAVSVWVRASAGSGKTKVLSDRIIRLLLDGAQPQKILCLTFTRAAAAEMEVRLTRRLARWATCQDATLDEELDELQGHAPRLAQRERARRLFASVLACPGGMRIHTIHAFAQEILGRFPIEAGVTPNFAVLEEQESKSLRRDAFVQALQAAAEDPHGKDARFLALLAADKSERTVVELVDAARVSDEKLALVLKREGGYEGLVAEIAKVLGVLPEDDEETLCAAFCKEGAFALQDLTRLGALMVERGMPSTQEYGRVIASWLASDEKKRARAIDEYLDVFITTKKTLRQKILNKVFKEEYPETLAVLDAEAERAYAFFEKRETLCAFREGAAVVGFALRVEEFYARKKAERGALDYDDLIKAARSLVTREGIAQWVLFKLDGGIDHILLDEAQDTSPAQWDIVKALTDEFFAGDGSRSDGTRTLFVVGDEKQSIYSFLKADPAEFSRRQASYGANALDVPLDTSFRSAPIVLRAVDAVFANPCAREGVSCSPVAHRPFRRLAPGSVEVWEPFLKEKKEKKEGDEKADKKPQEWSLPLGYERAEDPAFELAETLARQVKSWANGAKTVYDRKRALYRPSAPGDVLILVQTRGAFVAHLVRALKKEGVPTSGADRMVLADQLAVMDVVALLSFVLLPKDDLTLACVLRGPLIGAREEDLMALAVGREKDVSLWRRLCADERYEPWRAYLARVMELADRLTPFALAQAVLEAPCPADSLGGRRAMMARLGPEAEDPLDEFLTLAEGYCGREGPSLQSFLHWFAATKTEVKRELEQAEGRVRIATVHGAKGLEAPIVVLPDATHIPESNKLPVFLWDDARDLPFYAPRAEMMNGVLSVLRARARQAQLEEYRRLLYVGLTRAADHLVICGYGSKIDKESWYALVVAALEPFDDKTRAKETERAPKKRVFMEDIAPFQAQAESSQESAHENATVVVPAWAFEPPPPEPLPLKRLMPSRADEEAAPSLPSPRDARFRRGRVMHRLFEVLPDAHQDLRESVAKRFLSQPRHNLTPNEQEDMAQEALALVSHEFFAPLFSPQSMAEVPIVGVVGAHIVSGQVDRLALVGEEVWIVDYKTNRPPPENAASAPPVYKAQMEAYRSVLQIIYPGKTVRCFLLWTHTLELMEVSVQQP